MSDLRDEFQRQAPDAPSASGWADGARAKHRKRRTMTGVVAALAVVALAIPVGIALVRNSGQPVVPASPEPRATTVDFPERTSAEMCEPFAPPLETADDAMVAVDKLKEEPARIWLCPDSNNDFSNIELPDTPITDQELVQDAIATFNGFEELPGDVACTMEYTYTYMALFEYGDKTIPVRGELHGCKPLTTGSGDDVKTRYGGEEMLSTLLKMHRREHGGTSPEDAARAACDGSPVLILGDLERIEAGVACAGDFENPRTTVMDKDLAREVAGVELAEIEQPGSPDAVRLVLADADGGLRTLSYDGETLFDTRAWKGAKVSAELKEKLDAVVASMPN